MPLYDSKVFISYAHKDGLDFTTRLAYALSFYLGVFWDRRLQMGDYPRQLYERIEECDFFILVMTPQSLVSDWCKKELQHAIDCGKKIGLAKIYSQEEATSRELTDKYTYGDFEENFDAGFRRLTAMMFDAPYSSWEVLNFADDPTLLGAIESGLLPGVIAKEVAEWVIVDKLFYALEIYASKQTGFLAYAHARTPLGVIGQCSVLIEQFAQNRNVQGALIAQTTLKIAEQYTKELWLINEDKAQEIGSHVATIIANVRKHLRERAFAARDSSAFLFQGGYFDFEIAEKTRELILMHSRRSRYLY